jgi:phosphopantothenoylcysteine decarboxylase/phosphopantothenate--cysteine ligase
VGFAAETDDLLANASAKRTRKACDWIVANDVGEGSNVMNGERNRVHLITAEKTDSWPDMSKTEVAARLVSRIAANFGKRA